MKHVADSSLTAPYRGWALFICGVCMGSADLVPGISGGTIAFILGFYQPMLDSIKTFNWTAIRLLLTGNWRAFGQQVEWKFLLTLLSGIGFAFVCLANLFHSILSHELYRIYLYAAFLGLIIASCVFCMRQVQCWNYKTISGLCLGAVVAFFLTESTLSSAMDGGFAVPFEIKTEAHSLRNYDSERHLLLGLSPQSLGAMLDQGLLPATAPVYDSKGNLVGFVKDLGDPLKVSFVNAWLIVCGSLAVCALLLPGISGSYILTLLGVYPMVIEALVDFLKDLSVFSFNQEAFGILGSLGLGILFGAVAFARGVSWLLKTYPNFTLAVLSGFMIGAIRSVWPFWTYDYVVMPFKLYKGPQLVTLDPMLPSFASPLLWQAALCALAGFVLVFGLESYVWRRSAKSLV